MKWILWELEMEPPYFLVDVILGSRVGCAADHPDGNLMEIFGGLVILGARLLYEKPERKALQGLHWDLVMKPLHYRVQVVSYCLC